MLLGHAPATLETNMNWIKSEVLEHDPDTPTILHRKDIMGFKGVYQILREPEKRALFDRAILRLFASTPYTVITALIDKSWMLKQAHWSKTHPYHYLMEILVEKYVQFLERQKDIGDIMPESREGKDSLLQQAFNEVRHRGTDFLTATRIASALRGENLKFRKKIHNVSGLQLCDLLAHPSHIYTRSIMKHDVNLGPFATQVVNILTNGKYDCASWSGKIIGYGIKHLPQ